MSILVKYQPYVLANDHMPYNGDTLKLRFALPITSSRANKAFAAITIRKIIILFIISAIPRT